MSWKSTSKESACSETRSGAPSEKLSILKQEHHVGQPILAAAAFPGGSCFDRGASCGQLMSQHLVQLTAGRAAGDLHVQHCRQRWIYVIRRRPSIVSAGLDSRAHENDRHVRVVVV